MLKQMLEQMCVVLALSPAPGQLGERTYEMARATWNGAVIAESDDTVVVENNHYFPRDSVHAELLSESAKHTVCPWKGTASYYSISVDGQINADAAWYYPNPTPAAAQIADHIAFWKGVNVDA